MFSEILYHRALIPRHVILDSSRITQSVLYVLRDIGSLQSFPCEDYVIALRVNAAVVLKFRHAVSMPYHLAARNASLPDNVTMASASSALAIFTRRIAPHF